jgi:hypothetical protein
MNTGQPTHEMFVRDWSGYLRLNGCNGSLLSPRRRCLRIQAPCWNSRRIWSSASPGLQGAPSSLALLSSSGPKFTGNKADDVKSKEQVYRDQIMDFWRKRRYSLRKAEKKAAAAEIAAAAAAAAAAAEPVPAAANVAPAVLGAAVASASDEGGAAGSAARAPRRSTRSSPSKQKKN